MIDPFAPGGENLGRLKSRLRRNPEALAALAAMGLNAATVDRLHLGLREPYRSRAAGLEIRDAVCYPNLSEGLRAGNRYAYLNLPGFTVNAPRQTTWGPGPALLYRIGSWLPSADALVSAAVTDCWLAWQLARGDDAKTAFLSRTHSEGWPAEWSDPGFWRNFDRIVLLPGTGHDDFVREVAWRIGRPVLDLRLPAPLGTLADACRAADRRTLRELAASAEPLVALPPPRVGAVPSERLGRFAARPVKVTGAFVDGYGYYPVSVEHRTADAANDAPGLVQSYQTLVVRSDGHLLTTELLPAPKGTPRSERILALSDGTRIVSEPIASRTGTWSWTSVQEFTRWRISGGKRPFRPFDVLLRDVESFIRERVWLPVDGHFLLASLYVALSHVFQVFDAIPLLLVNGERATGKSELGEAIARLSFNAVIAGQLRAAGMIRLLDETAGLIVLDDMDGSGPASLLGNGEFAQAIKTSYKRSTATKPVADRGSKVRMVDFYGCKVISNVTGVDAVLGSRMLVVRTAEPPVNFQLPPPVFGDSVCDALRDELHCWAMVAGAAFRTEYVASPPPTGRRAEISLPLRLIASAAGSDVKAALAAVLENPLSYPDAR